MNNFQYRPFCIINSHSNIESWLIVEVIPLKHKPFVKDFLKIDFQRISVGRKDRSRLWMTHKIRKRGQFM